MLFGQLNWHTLDNLLIVSLQSGEKHAITVDDDEAEFVVVFEKGEQRLSMETVLALVGENVDCSEGRQVDRDFLLRLAVVQQDNTAEDAKTVLGCLLVQLQLLTRRGDGSEDGLARLTRLDGFGLGKLLGQQAHVLVDVVASGNVKGHERCAISSHKRKNQMSVYRV